MDYRSDMGLYKWLIFNSGFFWNSIRTQLIHMKKFLAALRRFFLREWFLFVMLAVIALMFILFEYFN